MTSGTTSSTTQWFVNEIPRYLWSATPLSTRNPKLKNMRLKRTAARQAFQLDGSPDFPVRCSWARATGKSPTPAGWKACPTFFAMSNFGVWVQPRSLTATVSVIRAGEAIDHAPMNSIPGPWLMIECGQFPALDFRHGRFQTPNIRQLVPNHDLPDTDNRGRSA